MKNRQFDNLDIIEYEIIGSLLNDNEIVVKCLPILQPHWFKCLNAQQIFSACQDLFKKKSLIDYNLIYTELINRNQIEAANKLINVKSKIHPFSVVENYIRLLTSRENKLKVIKITDEIEKQLAKPLFNQDLLQIKNEFLNNFPKIKVETPTFSFQLKEHLQYLKAVIEHKKPPDLLTTHYSTLDEVIHGYIPATMIVIGARCGVGKTTLAVNMMLNSSINLPPDEMNIFFSIEMKTSLILNKIYSIHCYINSYHFIDVKKLTIEEKNLVFKTYEKLKRLETLTIIDDVYYIEDILSYLRSDLKKKIKVVYIDYVQQIRTKEKIGSGSTYDTVTFVSDQLRIVAKELNITIVLLSQLSRQSEKREDKTPMLSDLRDSGAIEQDASVVLLLHDADYYKKKDEPTNKDHKMLTCYIAKNRFGLTKKLDFVFEPCYNKIHDASTGQEEIEE